MVCCLHARIWKSLFRGVMGRTRVLKLLEKRLYACLRQSPYCLPGAFLPSLSDT